MSIAGNLSSRTYLLTGDFLWAKISGGIIFVRHTTAFVPFIFVTLFNVAAFVCNFALRDEEKNTALPDNTAA